MSRHFSVRNVLFALSLGIFCPLSVSADVYLCDGKYTSTPCNDEAKALNLKPLSRSIREEPALPETSRQDQLSQATPSESSPPGSGPSEKASPELTRLRVLSDPTWQLELGGQFTRVSAGEAIIKNVGRTRANKIVVDVAIPGKLSNSVAMSGPEALEPGQSGTYTLKESSVIKRGAPLNVRIRCSNCWH